MNTLRRFLIHIILVALICTTLLCTACTSKPASDSDVKSLFLEWYFTSNRDSRWDNILETLNSSTNATDEDTVLPDNLLTADYSREVADAIDMYFNPVNEIIDSELKNRMILNRDPFKYDNMFLESESSSAPKDITFDLQSEEDGLKNYTFTAILIIDNYIKFEALTGISTDNGILEVSGQLTVENNMVKKFSLND